MFLLFRLKTTEISAFKKTPVLTLHQHMIGKKKHIKNVVSYGAFCQHQTANYSLKSGPRRYYINIWISWINSDSPCIYILRLLPCKNNASMIVDLKKLNF